jgi:MOSC domain-containing protein YiiM
VTRGLNENTVCIGDRVRIGGALVEVSQPRQPCYKLNLRFEEPGLSAAAEQNGRTGWYCRVVEPGMVAAGDAVEIVARPHPDWTVRRIQHLIFDEAPDRDAIAAAAQLPALAADLRARFTRRVGGGAG